MTERPGDPGFSPRSTQDSVQLQLGSALARLRRQRGLTGQQLGRLAGMSQAKVSKVENGVVTPSVRDVERMARALHAPQDVLQQLVDSAEGLLDQFTDWRITTRRLTSGQQQLAADEERARVMRVFQPAVVPGLLQTAEYARAVLSDYASAFSGERPGAEQREVRSAVSARIQRQEVLYGTGKRFLFVLTESVLTNRVCTAAEMVGQLDRIRTVAEYDNVEVRVVPADARLDYPPVHGYQLFDDRVVVVDMMSTTVVSRGKADLAVYRAVFDYFRQRAEPDAGPVLGRHLRGYADLTAGGDPAAGQPS